MENSFQKYISTFNELTTDDKKEELIKHFKELFEYLKIEHLPESQYTKIDGFIFEQLADVPEENSVYEYIAIDDILQEDASIIQRKVKLTFTLTKVEDDRIREIALNVEPLEEEKTSL